MKIISSFTDFYDYATCRLNEGPTWKREVNFAEKVIGRREKKTFAGGNSFTVSTWTEYEVPQEIKDRIEQLKRRIKSFMMEDEHILVFGKTVVSAVFWSDLLFLKIDGLHSMRVYAIEEEKEKNSFLQKKRIVSVVPLENGVLLRNKKEIKEWLKKNKKKCGLVDVCMGSERIRWITEQRPKERLERFVDEVRKEFSHAVLFEAKKETFYPNREYVEIKFNPLLKDTFWKEILDAAPFYQEIETYLVEMEEKERVVPDMDDETKISAHGFDKKSFRKKKSGQK